MTLAIQHLVDALNVGGLYALMALGIGLIFGVMRLINFAHGEFVMVGAYAIWSIADLPTPLVLVTSVAVVLALALSTERVAFRPLRMSDPSTLLVTSFAVSYFLQSLAVMVFGARAKPFTLADSLSGSIELDGIRISLLQMTSLSLTLGALLVLSLMLKHTRIGIQLRAVSQDVQAARLSGVRVDRVIAFAFVLSGLLAWVVSVVYSSQIAQITPNMGVRPVVIGFVATILGGLGSLGGAALGGFFVGGLTVFLDALLPLELRVFKEAFLFALVLAMLLLRPEGLVAVRALRERV